MSYQDKQIKKTHNGHELVQLSVAKEILAIRPDIEKNVQHAGGQLELVYQAFCEIQKAHGHHPVKLDPSCSGCTLNMNKLLINWFKLYDKGSVVAKAHAGGVKSKPLVPIKDKKATVKKTVTVAQDLSNKKKPEPEIDYSEMSYGQLLKAFEKKASKKDQKEINGGNKPKKAQLLDYFNE